MTAILLPVDGSPHALHAVQRLVADRRAGTARPQVHLLSVQPRWPRHLARWLRRGDAQTWRAERAQAALAPAAQRLRAAGFVVHEHVAVGDRVRLICHQAEALRVQAIVIGAARRHGLAQRLVDGALLRLLHTAPVPVQVVSAGADPLWARWGLPAGVLAGAGGLLAMALD